MCVLQKHKIKVCISCTWLRPRPSVPGPLKGTLSAPKALQGSETEIRICLKQTNKNWIRSQTWVLEHMWARTGSRWSHRGPALPPAPLGASPGCGWRPSGTWSHSQGWTPPDTPGRPTRCGKLPPPQGLFDKRVSLQWKKFVIIVKLQKDIIFRLSWNLCSYSTMNVSDLKGQSNQS